ncbi:MAG: sigma-54 dependent transcriptional regulator, partial [bacterium]
MTEKTPKVLIVEDDVPFAERLQKNLALEGFDAEVAESGAEALRRLASAYFDLVVTDLKMPDVSGIDLLKRVKQGKESGIDPDIPMVVLTSVNAVDTAVEAMKLGAADYITKESEKQEIVVRLRKVLEQSHLLNENRYLRDQLEKRSEFGEFIGESAAIKKIKEEILEVAQSDALVIIVGDTGVGKELVARAIHRTSPRTRGPFMDLNCAALPDESLFQSELFGHERGAFTGAIAQKKGKLEIASGGTVFLDEISELSRDSQAKILKAIEQLQITRIGGNRTIQLDCRFICATNRDLGSEVKAGRFREDLYYRVNVFPILIPPLRQRTEDIPVLVNFFLAHFSRKYLKPPRRVDDLAMALMRNYAWPGNVRELRNILERLVIRSRNPSISF